MLVFFKFFLNGQICQEIYLQKFIQYVYVSFFVIELLLRQFFFFSITELFGQAGRKILERVGKLELPDALSHYQSGPAQSENGERVSSLRERVC